MTLEALRTFWMTGLVRLECLILFEQKRTACSAMVMPPMGGCETVIAADVWQRQPAAVVGATDLEAICTARHA